MFFQDARSLVGDQIGLETELQQRAEIDVPATRPTSELFSVLEPGGWRDVWQIGLVVLFRLGRPLKELLQVGWQLVRRSTFEPVENVGVAVAVEADLSDACWPGFSAQNGQPGSVPMARIGKPSRHTPSSRTNGNGKA